MAHVAKYSRGSVRNLTRHYERATDKNGEYVKFGNESIDTNKTHLNYNLAPNRDMKQSEFIKQKCDEFNCLKRDNIKVMCSWVVTAPKDLPEYQQKEFFEQSYKFLNNRYGKDNVVSSYVHMDETSPHMHYSFVPVVYDQKKEKYKVSAKDAISRHDLQTFHKDLSKHMEHHFGRDIGVINEATKEGNKSIEELKRQSATQRIELVKAKSERIISDANTKASQMLQNAHEKVEKVKNDVKPLEDEKRALEGQIGGLKATLNTYHDIDQIGKKGILGKINVTPEELKQLKTQAKAYLGDINKIRNLEYKLDRYESDLSEMKSVYNQLMDVKGELKETKSKLKAMETIIKSSPDLVKAFNKQAGVLRAEHEQQRQAQIKSSKSFGMER